MFTGEKQTNKQNKMNTKVNSGLFFFIPNCQGDNSPTETVPWQHTPILVWVCAAHSNIKLTRYPNKQLQMVSTAVGIQNMRTCVPPALKWFIGWLDDCLDVWHPQGCMLWECEQSVAAVLLYEYCTAHVNKSFHAHPLRSCGCVALAVFIPLMYTILPKTPP